MKRASPEVVMDLAIVQRQHKALAAYLGEWLQDELDKLPYAAGNTAALQGRCQVLKELNTLLKESPAMVADPKWRQQSTHTDRSVT